MSKIKTVAIIGGGVAGFPGYGVGPAAMSGILAAETLIETEHIA